MDIGAYGYTAFDIGAFGYFVSAGGGSSGIITARISQKGTINYGGPLA